MITLPKAITFWKVRGSYARVGGDPDSVQQYRELYAGHTLEQLRPPLIFADKIFNEEIEPAFSSSIEVGTDLRVLDNRIGIDAA